MQRREGALRYLKEFNPRFGKFAITGNHEVYAGLRESLEAIRQSGFTILQGKTVQAGGINIAGIDDPTAGMDEDEQAILLSGKKGLFTLFLKHRPEVSTESRGLFDLQLSGHTHRGQVFPFRYISELVFPMQNGFYRLDKGSLLYTSSGSGTWGPPIRVLAPPEVTIIELERG